MSRSENNWLVIGYRTKAKVDPWGSESRYIPSICLRSWPQTTRIRNTFFSGHRSKGGTAWGSVVQHRFVIPWSGMIGGSRAYVEWVSEWDWLPNITCNDISVIYVTAHRCTGGLKKSDLQSDSQRHRHSAGLFNVPVQAPTRGQPFYTVIPRNRPI